MKQSLFRSIRHKLLREGKLLRYLSYAVGEVVLIIVGILMALKINDSNEDKKAQVEFEDYLIQLQVDIERAITYNQEVADYVLARAQDSHELITFLEGSDRSEEAIIHFERNLLNRLGDYRSPQFNVGLLGELLNGKTEVISRDPVLYQSSLDALSQLLNLEDVSAHILRNVDDFRSQLSARYAGAHPAIPEMDFSYDLNYLENSAEFRYLAQSIARRQASAHMTTRRIIRFLNEFLTVLEEYE